MDFHTCQSRGASLCCQRSVGVGIRRDGVAPPPEANYFWKNWGTFRLPPFFSNYRHFRRVTNCARAGRPSEHLRESSRRLFPENQVAWYAYGYFVWTPNGVVHSGHDFDPTLDTFKVGDSLGVRSGVEGIVIGILKGEPAKKSGGYDVFVLVGQREPLTPAAPAMAVQDFFQTPDGGRLRRMLT